MIRQYSLTRPTLTSAFFSGRNGQRHLGVIETSNLCTEIVQYASSSDPAVCTLSSIGLPRFVRRDRTFDFDTLHAVAKVVVRNTDRLIDVGRYPTGQVAASAKRTRALGVGVQGLADVFMIMGLPYSSPAARELNARVFETIYHAALEASAELAQKHGPYPAWSGSPASQGILYFDMWSVGLRCHYDFSDVRSLVSKYGLRNSLLTAQMPTASTAHVMGNSEGVEPYSR